MHTDDRPGYASMLLHIIIDSAWVIRESSYAS